MLQTERLGQRPELLSFAGVDRLEAAAVSRAAARLDLTHHERFAAGDEIELAEAAPPIARHDPVATPDVMPFDRGLTAPTDVDARVHRPTIGSVTDMTDMVETAEGTPTAEEYAAFRAHVRWPAVDPAQGVEGLGASLASMLARDVDGTLVGMGRIVGDGGVYLYLQDVIVLERWRNHGIGTRITEALLDHVRGARRPRHLRRADGGHGRRSVLRAVRLPAARRRSARHVAHAVSARYASMSGASGIVVSSRRSSSTFTSRRVITCTLETNRAGRNMSQTHASVSRTCTHPSSTGSTSTLFAR